MSGEILYLENDVVEYESTGPRLEVFGPVLISSSVSSFIANLNRISETPRLAVLESRVRYLEPEQITVAEDPSLATNLDRRYKAFHAGPACYGGLRNRFGRGVPVIFFSTDSEKEILEHFEDYWTQGRRPGIVFPEVENVTYVQKKSGVEGLIREANRVLGI